ncbi:MAG: hypothetical protein H7144_01525 [Burkholderiales bacterium]|nr:hypothetical protein [Phycisphaerae bacterium]
MTSRRVLIVSTTFFPDPQVAAIRMTQWCRHLPDKGWQPIVACRHYGYDATREVLDDKVHPGVEVRHLTAAPTVDRVRAQERTWSPLRQIQTALASLVYSPDASARFWTSIDHKLLALVDEFKPEVILTTAPPYGIHRAGMRLARKTGIPWVADFREAFIADPRYRPRGLHTWQWPAYRKYEKDVYQQAALVIHQLPVHQRWARRQYPFAKHKCVTMINGFSDALIDGSIAPELASGGRRSVRVVGTCLDGDALKIAQAVARMVRGGHDMELRFVGRLPETLPQMRELLGDRVIATGYVRYDRAVAEILGADVLVNYLSDQRRSGMIISTKLIEYIATRKPVVEVNPTWSNRRFARHWPQVKRLDDASDQALAAALIQANGASIAPDTEQYKTYCEDFRWSRQVETVAGWFNAVADRRPIVE